MTVIDPRKKEDPAGVGGPIFVGGYDRTGTTLMQGIICSDRETFPPTEECFYLQGLVIAYANARRDFALHTKDYFDSVEQFTAFHRGIIRRYLDHISARWGTDRIVVQKDPVLTMFFPELLELVPESRFVVMVRDPRDVIASQIVRLRKENPQDPRSVRDLLNEYIFRYMALLQKRRLFGDRLMFVHYERLVMEPDEVLESLRSFTSLDLPWDAGSSTWESKRPEDCASYSKLDEKPLTSQSVGTHRLVLSEGDIALVESQRRKINDFFGLDVFFPDG